MSRLHEAVIHPYRSMFLFLPHGLIALDPFIYEWQDALYLI